MAGYIRQDTTNNIADGNVINASDFDNEYNAIEAAFHASTGHTHDGTSAEGAPITKVGPAQDLVVGTGSAAPKTNNVMDLGTTSLRFKDVYAAGTAYIATLDLTNALAVADGGTGASTLTGVVKGNGTSAFTAGTVSLSTEVSGTLPVGNGGTGAATFTANNVLLGNGTSAFQVVAPGTSGNILTSNGTTWTSDAPAVTLAGNNAFTGANTFYNATGQTFGTATSTQDGVIIAGRAGGTLSYRVTLQPTTLTASRTLTLPDNSGTILTTGAAVTVAQGGTGLTTLTANNVILGNGTSTPTFVAPGTSGNVLTSNGTTWSSTAPAVTLAGNNAFTGANTFYNGTGQTFGTGTSTQDGIVLAGRAGGTTSLRVTLQPGTLTSSRTLTLPDATTTVTGTDATQTLTNKRIDPRVVSAASASSLTPDVSVADMYAYTALAAALTINAPTGTPVNGTKLMFRILDNGTARALNWDGTYTVIGVTLPTTTVINKTTYVGCVYNAAATRWDVIAVTTQA